MSGTKRRSRRSGVTPLRILTRSKGNRVDPDSGEVYTHRQAYIAVPAVVALNFDDEAQFLAEATPEGDLLYRRVALPGAVPAPFDE